MKLCVWIVLGTLVGFVSLYAMLLFSVDAFGAEAAKVRYHSMMLSSAAHIYLGAVALLIAPFQIHAVFRNRFLPIHKKIGYVYFVAVFISALGGLHMAINAKSTIVGDIGFALLAILWFITGLMGLVTIKQSRIEEHKQWMLRNVALTFAAISLRIELPLLIAVFGFSPAAAFEIVAWASWLPQLLLVEFCMRDN